MPCYSNSYIFRLLSYYDLQRPNPPASLCFLQHYDRNTTKLLKRSHMITWACFTAYIALTGSRFLALHGGFNHFLAFSRDPEDVRQLADPLSTSRGFFSDHAQLLGRFYTASVLPTSAEYHLMNVGIFIKTLILLLKRARSLKVFLMVVILIQDPLIEIVRF